MVSPALFSKQSDEWETPQEVFNALDAEFKFRVDAAATQENRKCDWYIPVSADALSVPWYDSFGKGPIWLNPPYSQVGAFIKKAYLESEKGATVVCLIPARTDTRWWHDYVMKAKEVRLIKGRLKFGRSKNSAPFPSAIVVFQGTCCIYGLFSSYILVKGEVTAA